MEKLFNVSVKWVWSADEFDLAYAWHQRGHDWQRHIFPWANDYCIDDFRLVSFGDANERDEILCWMAAMELRPATVKEIVSFALQHPDECIGRIAALGSEIRDSISGPVGVPVLERDAGGLKIAVRGRDAVNGKEFVFLVTDCFGWAFTGEFISGSDNADTRDIFKRILSIRSHLHLKRG